MTIRRRSSSLRADVPPELARIVHKCLVKEPAKRYQHADDLAVDLRDAAHRARRTAPRCRRPPRVARRGLATGWWLAIVAAAVVVGAFVTWQFCGRPICGAAPVVRFEVPTDAQRDLQPRDRRVARRPVRRRTPTRANAGLTVRALDQIEAAALPGTRGARDIRRSLPTAGTSCSGSDQIKRVRSTAAPSSSVGPAPGRPLGISWATDGFIYYGRGAEGIWRMPESGGSRAGEGR